MDTIAQHGIDRIDMLVVNLYPFRETIARPGCTFADAVENIDIGGPAMLRAAAKNHGTDAGGVTVVIDLADYSRVLAQMDQGGATRSEEHTSELQSLMRISYAGFCLIKKQRSITNHNHYR